MSNVEAGDVGGNSQVLRHDRYCSVDVDIGPEYRQRTIALEGAAVQFLISRESVSE